MILRRQPRTIPRLKRTLGATGCGTWWVLLWLSFLNAGFGQLAITEVMSEASALETPKRPDFWELTNFGDRRIDLTPYRWIDSAGFDAADPGFFAGRSIAPHESILLVRSNVTTTLTAGQFKEWWGTDRMRPQAQILFYRGPGFSPDQDAVRLWFVSETETNLVDEAEFFAATPGVTFTYDPSTGEFDSLSRLGVDGAFHSARGGEVGSPGVTSGPVPLKIVGAPESTEVDAGSPAVFSVRVQGLPRPRYQWRFNGAPIPGAREKTFVVTNALASDEGEYSVEVDNGIESLVSAAAVLKVNRNPSCAQIVVPPQSLDLTPGQTAQFTVRVRGFPLPRVQWSYQGQPISGATNQTFAVVGISPAFSGPVEVAVENAFCSTNVVVSLRVLPPPDLRITEAMAFPSPHTSVKGHSDWWELTNFGSNAVPLRGYRFDDTPGSLAGAFSITNDIVIQPGESVLFISDMTRAQFVRWWGEESLPVGVQIVSYPGNSFDSSGDSIFLWNATASSRSDTLAAISFVADTPGVSLWFDAEVAEFGELSVEGERGAFRAVESDDLGSPGWIGTPETPPAPRIVSARHEAGRMVIVWRTRPGQVDDVEFSETLENGKWSVLQQVVAEGFTASLADPAGYAGQRFYRVVHRGGVP